MLLSILFCQAVGTNSPIVQISSFDSEPLWRGGRSSQKLRGRLNIEDTSTLMAKEVGMRLSDPIEISIFAINGEHAHHPMLHEQAEGVVNSSFRKRRDVIH